MHDARWIGPLKRAAMALALVAALGKGAPAEEPPPLRVGMAPNYPPLAFKKDGHLQGIEVDFAKRLGGALNRKIEIIDSKGDKSIVTTPNVFQSNGVIHVVDTVLLPG